MRLELIERAEFELDSMSLTNSTDARAMLQLYERLGGLCLEARFTDRGALHMTRALDIADGLGWDDDVAKFRRLRERLLARAEQRVPESGARVERAAAFRG